jgi:hypothetical protein
MGSPAGGTTPTGEQLARTNAILVELTKDGRADVSACSIHDIVRLAQTLGWEGAPRFDFEPNGKVYVSAPGRRRRRSTTENGAAD